MNLFLLVCIFPITFAVVNYEYSNYDYNFNIFSPNGDLMQVSYAETAAKSGGLLACITLSTGEIIVCTKSNSLDALMDRRCVDKVQRVDENVWMSFSGLTGDGRFAVRHMRGLCLQVREKLGCGPTVFSVANLLAQQLHQSTIQPGRCHQSYRVAAK